MSSRLNLGGWYPSKGEKSLGELRARFFVEYSNALQNKIGEIYMNNPDDFDNPREVLVAILNGEYDEELSAENEVNPDEYDKEEWVEEYKSDETNASESGAETAEADD